MRSPTRAGFSVFQLLVVLAILGIIIGLLLPAIQRVREAAMRTQSLNNLKQLALAAHSYHDAHKHFPAGLDKNGFSAHAHLLPYIEQDALYRTMNFNVPITANANAQARQTRVPVYFSPRDPLASSAKHSTPSSYLFSAGSKYSLENNNGAFFKDSKVNLVRIADGTSNTLLAGETLVGDFGADARDVHRQHVKLGKDALANLGKTSGQDDWKNSKNIAGDRGAAWIDGSFLQTTFTGTRIGNDALPDVTCAGEGGLSALRSHGGMVLVAFCDGSARVLRANLGLDVWQLLTDGADGNVLPNID